MLQSMGSQRVGHDQATELNWTHSSVCTPPSTPQPATSGQHTLVVHPGKWITFTWYLTVLYFTVLFFKYASVFAQTKWPMLWVISHHKKVQKSFWLYQPRCCWVAKLCPTLCNPMGCSMPGSYVLHSLSWSLLKFMSIEVVMSSNLLILYHPLLFLLSIFPSIRVFSNESALLIRWPKYWSFSFSISPSNEYPGLISFRMDWFNLLAVQGTLKSLLQHHSSKASILWHSAFFMVQLSHPYMTTRKASLASSLK